MRVRIGVVHCFEHKENGKTCLLSNAGEAICFDMLCEFLWSESLELRGAAFPFKITERIL